jgi:ketosteroid isomerase-like protein
MRIRLSTIVVLLGLAASPSAAQSTSDMAGVLATVKEFHAAMTAGDAARAMTLVADDAVFVEAGGVETRAQFEKDHLPADFEFEKGVTIKRGPTRVVVVGDAAWATTISEMKGSYRGRAVDSIGAELMVLSRTGGGWRIRAVHWSGRARVPA